MIRYQLINACSFPKILLLFWSLAICHLGYAQNIQIYTNKPQPSSVENKAKVASDKVEKKIIEKTQSFSDSLKLKKKEKKLREALKIVQAADSIRKLQDKEKALRQEVLRKAEQKVNTIKEDKRLRKARKIVDLLQNGKINKNYKDSIQLGDRIYLGGDFGWAFGQSEIFLNVAPLIGYKINDKLSVGVGAAFQYWRTQLIFVDKDTGINYITKSTTLFYGARSFARLTLLKGLFANVEGEMLNSGIFDREGHTTRRWSPVLWAGFGYNIKISKLASINVIGLYNPIYDASKTPYKSPFDLRIGFQW